MIDLAEVTHVYLAREPVDFRRQIDGLSLHVQEVLALDPFAPQVFVFRNRRGDKLKALTWHVVREEFVTMIWWCVISLFFSDTLPSQSRACLDRVAHFPLSLNRCWQAAVNGQTVICWTLTCLRYS